MANSAIVTWGLARLGEPSTWRGLAWLLAATGIALSPDQVAAIAGTGAAISGAIGVFFPDGRAP